MFEFLLKMQGKIYCTVAPHMTLEFLFYKYETKIHIKPRLIISILEIQLSGTKRGSIFLKQSLVNESDQTQDSRSIRNPDQFDVI